MIPAAATTNRNAYRDANGKPSLQAALVCLRRGVCLASWSVAILFVTGSVGNGQGRQSVTVEIVLPQSENESGPSPAEIAEAVLEALGADASLRMANFGHSANEALGDGPETFDMVVTLIQIASPSKITTYNSLNNRVTLSPVDDFKAFCDAIDYARILKKNESRRYVKIHIKRGKLTKENLIKRAQQAGREELTDQLYGDKSTGRLPGFPADFPSGISGLGRSTSDDEADFKAGVAVEVEIGNDLYQGVVIKKAKWSEYVVSLTDTKAVSKGWRSDGCSVRLLGSSRCRLSRRANSFASRKRRRVLSRKRGCGKISRGGLR